MTRSWVICRTLEAVDHSFKEIPLNPTKKNALRACDSTSVPESDIPSIDCCH